MTVEWDPASRAHAIWLTAVIAPIFTGIFVILRLTTRIFVTKTVALNDWIALATLPFVVAFSVTLAQATYNGMGSHQAWFDDHPYQEERYYFWILVSSECGYLPSLLGYKTSILLLYLSVFEVSQRFRYCCYATLLVVWGYLVSNLITQVAGCHPIQKFWIPSTPGHCILTTDADIFYGAFNMFTDLIIAILPIPMIWRLQHKNIRERIGIAIVLSGGFVAFAVAVIRYGFASKDLTSSDRTWVAGLTFLWSVLEVNTGLIASSTPALKPFLRAAKERSFSWSQSRSTTGASRSARPSFNTTQAMGPNSNQMTTMQSSRKQSWRSGNPFSRKESDATTPASPGGTPYRRPSLWTIRKPSEAVVTPPANLPSMYPTHSETSSSQAPTLSSKFGEDDIDKEDVEEAALARISEIRESGYYTYEEMIRQV